MLCLNSSSCALPLISVLKSSSPLVDNIFDSEVSEDAGDVLSVDGNCLAISFSPLVTHPSPSPKMTCTIHDDMLEQSDLTCSKCSGA